MKFPAKTNHLIKWEDVIEWDRLGEKMITYSIRIAVLDEDMNAEDFKKDNWKSVNYAIVRPVKELTNEEKSTYAFRTYAATATIENREHLKQLVESGNILKPLYRRPNGYSSRVIPEGED
jgi:hypothetical protein